MRKAPATAGSSPRWGMTHQTPAASRRKDTHRMWMIFLAPSWRPRMDAPSPAPIAEARRAVRPLEVPTQQARARNSRGRVRPMAAMDASPSGSMDA